MKLTEAQRKEIWRDVLKKVAPVVKDNHNPTFSHQLAVYLDVEKEYLASNIFSIDRWMLTHNLPDLNIIFILNYFTAMDFDTNESIHELLPQGKLDIYNCIEPNYFVIQIFGKK